MDKSQISADAPIIPENIEIPIECPRDAVITVENPTDRAYVIRVQAFGTANDMLYIRPLSVALRPGEKYDIEVSVAMVHKIPHGCTREFDISYHHIKLEDVDTVDLPHYWLRKKAEIFTKCQVTFVDAEEKKKELEEEKREAKKSEKSIGKSPAEIKKQENSIMKSSKTEKSNGKSQKSMGKSSTEKLNNSTLKSSKTEKSKAKSETEKPENSTVKSSKTEKSVTENTKTEKSTLRSSKTTAANSEIQSKSGIEEKEKSQKVEKPPKKKNPCCVII